MNKKLYTEDEIIDIGESLKELKDKTIIDYNLDFFKLIDYDIKSMEVEMFNLFGKNPVVNMFYIDTMKLTNGKEEFIYNSDDIMCTEESVMSLLDYRYNFIVIKDNYEAFISLSSKNMFVNEE